ncbi:MAG: hypothetical protein WAX44_02795 [Minisyncoccia bacterium]
MTTIWMITVLVNLFLIRIFYLGLREKQKNGQSIIFELILLSAMYGGVLYLVISTLINGSDY